MRIALDARWIFPSLSGVGIYTRELITQFVQQDQKNEYILLFDDAEIMKRVGRETGFDQAENFEAIHLPFGIFSITNQWALPRLLKQKQVTVYHSPNYMIPLLGKIPTICTMHDLIPIVLRDHARRSRKSRLFPVYLFLMKRIAQKAKAIIAVSDASKRDIEKHLGAPDHKVKRIYNGIGEAFKPGEQAAGGPPVILSVGRFDPYKNVPRLIEAFSQLGHPDARLHLVGKTDSRYPEAAGKVRELGLSDRVDWSEDLSTEALVESYQQASVFVLASRYEGFGLPVAEAMACGTPVVCSNTSSLPEVAGDAALLINPEQPAEIACAIKKILSDPAIAESLRAKGLEQSTSFSWAQSAQEVLALYHAS